MNLAQNGAPPYALFNRFQLEQTLSIPEPDNMALMGLGVLALLISLRRRKLT